MNPYDEEMLGAYVDGELDDAAREAFERALAADPELARRVETQRRLRLALDSAFAPTLDEPLPERLLRAAQGHGPGTVVPMRTLTGRATRWQAPHWWAMAASLVVGAVLGRQVLAPQADATLLTTGPEGVVATGVLAKALSQQLAADRRGVVQIGLSFRAKSGDYCRTFEIRGAGASQAGLACREGEAWHVQIVEAVPPDTTAGGAMRQASSTALPVGVRRAVEASIAGDVLDAPAEVAARNAGWQ